MADIQFVIFRLGEERYGIEILNVAGITEFTKINKVPNAPPYVEGVMNLRGDVIPVVNLKKRFNIPITPLTEESRIILITLNDSIIGFLVDDANQVVKINTEDIEDTPTILRGEERKYLKGVGKLNGELYILLDMENIMNDMETKEVIELSQSGE